METSKKNIRAVTFAPVLLFLLAQSSLGGKPRPVDLPIVWEESPLLNPLTHQEPSSPEAAAQQAKFREAQTEQLAFQKEWVASNLHFLHPKFKRPLKISIISSEGPPVPRPDPTQGVIQIPAKEWILFLKFSTFARFEREKHYAERNKKAEASSGDLKRLKDSLKSAIDRKDQLETRKTRDHIFDVEKRSLSREIAGLRSQISVLEGPDEHFDIKQEDELYKFEEPLLKTINEQFEEIVKASEPKGSTDGAGPTAASARSEEDEQ